MKKRLIIIAVVLAVLFLIFTLLKNVFCVSGCYKNNNSLDKKTNNEIKSLLLNSIKDHWIKLYNIDKSELYTEDCIRDYLPEPEHWGKGEYKHWFIIIDGNFMDTVTEMGNDGYEAYIQLSYPGDNRFYYTIKLIDGRYIITKLEIDA